MVGGAGSGRWSGGGVVWGGWGTYRTYPIVAGVCVVCHEKQ